MYRSGADFAYEADMTAVNRFMAPEIETLFLPSSPGVGSVSSAFVRRIVELGGDVSRFVPPAVLTLMAASPSPQRRRDGSAS